MDKKLPPELDATVDDVSARDDGRGGDFRPGLRLGDRYVLAEGHASAAARRRARHRAIRKGSTPLEYALFAPRATTPTRSIDPGVDDSVDSPDGKTIYYTVRQPRVHRQVITNFGDRPRL